MAENTSKPTPNAPLKKEAPAPKPVVAEKTAPVAAKPPSVPKPTPVEIKAAPVVAKPVPAPQPVAAAKEPSVVAAPKAPVAAVKPAPVAPKTKSTPMAQAPAPKPAEVVASKQDEPTAKVIPTAPVAPPAPKTVSVAKLDATPSASAITEGSRIMNETMTKAQETAKKFTADAGERVQAMFGEVSERAKGAYEKGVKLTEELTEFQKGNVEALVESSKLAAKAAESLGQEAADYARKSFESSTAAFKTFASAKSPSELFKLQSDYMKSSFEAAVSESSKVTETWLKLAGDVAQPLSNRFAVAVEKAKANAAF